MEDAAPTAVLVDKATAPFSIGVAPPPPKKTATTISLSKTLTNPKPDEEARRILPARRQSPGLNEILLPTKSSGRNRDKSSKRRKYRWRPPVIVQQLIADKEQLTKEVKQKNSTIGRLESAHANLVKNHQEATDRATAAEEKASNMIRLLKDEVLALKAAYSTAESSLAAAEQQRDDELFKLECPICMEVKEQMYALEPCGHRMCAECNANYKEWSCHIYRKSSWNRLKLH